MINKMANAGGWLNQVKVTLGFIELALALKFFSNADLVKGWRILDREIFIAIWVVIAILLAMYLLGKLKLSHDDANAKNIYGQEYVSPVQILPRFIGLDIRRLSDSRYVGRATKGSRTVSAADGYAGLCRRERQRDNGCERQRSTC